MITGLVVEGYHLHVSSLSRYLAYIAIPNISGYVGQGMSSVAESKVKMVGVSIYGDAYCYCSGLDRAEDEIRIFDDEVFPEFGPGSGL